MIKVRKELFPFRQQSLPSRFGVTSELVVILVTMVIAVDLLLHFFGFKVDLSRIPIHVYLRNSEDFVFFHIYVEDFTYTV